MVLSAAKWTAYSLRTNALTAHKCFALSDGVKRCVTPVLPAEGALPTTGTIQ